MLRTIAVTTMLLALTAACSSSRPNRDPTGEIFPSVRGETLDGQERLLPRDLEGPRTVLLVGYVQDTQFDLDRWILGLLQAGVDVPIFEVPTIEGLLPGLAAGQIDGGMRRGIPSEDWGSVITVYGDAGKITALTGTENPRNGRVLLLDGEGRVIWFHDRGYSAGTLMSLLDAIRS